MGTAIEDHAHDFVEGALEAAVDGDPLHEAELHDTLYRRITKPFGIRIGDGESSLTPSSGAEEILEHDGEVPIVIYSRVEGPDRRDRKAARSRMLDVAKAVAKLFLNDPTMGGRVNDSRVTKCLRGWDEFETIPYSVANMSLLVNETGGALP